MRQDRARRETAVASPAHAALGSLRSESLQVETVARVHSSVGVQSQVAQRAESGLHDGLGRRVGATAVGDLSDCIGGPSSQENVPQPVQSYVRYCEWAGAEAHERGTVDAVAEYNLLHR